MKAAEHVIKSMIESKREFVKHKQSCAALGIRHQGMDPGGDVGWLKMFWEALRVKSRMLEALMRVDRTNEGTAKHTGREPLPDRSR